MMSLDQHSLRRSLELANLLRSPDRTHTETLFLARKGIGDNQGETGGVTTWRQTKKTESQLCSAVVGGVALFQGCATLP